LLKSSIIILLSQNKKYQNKYVVNEDLIGIQVFHKEIFVSTAINIERILFFFHKVIQSLIK